MVALRCTYVLHVQARSVDELPADALCTHHFVSSWVAHNASAHADTEQRRRDGHSLAAMEGRAQPVRLRTTV